MVFDCFLFNDEIDILQLRLTYMSKHVDRFVIGESTQTLSGLKKPLNYLNNKELFAQFSSKILHVIIPEVDGFDAWQMESYQRNYLKQALTKCDKDDLIIIADVDELIDLEYLLDEYDVNKPCLIEIPMYYYFFNLKTKIEWHKTLISPYKYIVDFNIGNRDTYRDLKPKVIKGKTKHLGWHFSYVFGYDTSLYISKLKSFSHQEYNTPYFLNSKRIVACIKQGVDFLERNSVYTPVDVKAEFPVELLRAIDKTCLSSNYIYKSPGLIFYFDLLNFKYLIKFKLKPLLKEKLVSLKLMKNN